MMEWQPIETAPKDGGCVLLWLPEPWAEVEKAGWCGPWETWVRGGPPGDPDGEMPYGIGSLIPTHWMPLPEPPK